MGKSGWSAGITYARGEPAHPLPADAPAEAVLEAYGREIDRLKAEGGYVTADVIDVKPQTPGLDAMLAKFSREHWHDEDEVRFIVQGRGIFHIHPRPGPVFARHIGIDLRQSCPTVPPSHLLTTVPSSLTILRNDPSCGVSGIPRHGICA